MSKQPLLLLIAGKPRLSVASRGFSPLTVSAALLFSTLCRCTPSSPLIAAHCHPKLQITQIENCPNECSCNFLGKRYVLNSYNIHRSYKCR
ncbi:hypothetical protein Pyn_40569 [Prunus yedoensis var. nudiflora]|uniref:Uncharacterized protein n=1 Tax=Prunus yedoensis var. nudiflora TaxID=2094558 RepID=A0A314ZHP1_PRUYE|nr:hypothetical protein Pyn_40569 [Prunus yedoensis var. nudiflora]